MATFKIQKPKYSPKVQEYREKFGHPPSADALKWKRTEELEKLATMALRRGKPIKEWAERPNKKLGVVTDGWYAQKNSASSDQQTSQPKEPTT